MATWLTQRTAKLLQKQVFPLEDANDGNKESQD